MGQVITVVPAIVEVLQRERWWRRVHGWLAERGYPPTDDPEILAQWGYQCWHEEELAAWEQEFHDQRARRALVTLMLPGAVEPEDLDLVRQIATSPMPPERFTGQILAPVVDGLRSGNCWWVFDPSTEAEEYIVAGDAETAREVGAAWLSAAPGSVAVTRIRMQTRQERGNRT